MEIIFCEDKKEWNNFVIQNEGNFLQSFEWGELQKKSNLKVFRIKIEELGKTIMQAQISKESFLSKNYLYIPFGPIFDNNLTEEKKLETIVAFLKELEKISTTENCIFLRIEPIKEIKKISGYKFHRPLRRIQPQKTLLIDLNKSEEELLKDFSSTTRHNIKRAERSGVTIKEMNEYNPSFYGLLSKTKERQEFGVYPEEHYKDLFDIKDEFLNIKLFLAEYNSKIINATIVLFFNETTVTLHSGSDYHYRNVKGTNLLRWTVITTAKKNGMKRIDMWGIDEKKWPNLTTFKKGFGGQEFEYPEGIDIVFQTFWYSIYKVVRIIKKFI